MGCRILLVIYTYIYIYIYISMSSQDVLTLMRCHFMVTFCGAGGHRRPPQERGSHLTQLCHGVLMPLLSVLTLSFYECSLGPCVLELLSFFLSFFWLECNCFCCVRFCCSTKWISYAYTYISHLGSLSHPCPHPTPLGHHRPPSWNCSHVMHTFDFVPSKSSLYANFHLLFFKSTQLYSVSITV